MALTLDQILALLQEKSELIEDRLTKLEKMILQAANRLDKELLGQFVEGLSIEDGVIVASDDNIQRVAAIERIWREFEATHFRIISRFVADLTDITNLGAGYYTELIPTQPHSKTIKATIDKRLGIKRTSGRGWEPVKGGYISALLEDRTLVNQVRKTAYQGIIGKQGPKALEKMLKNLVVGDEGKVGAYANFFNLYALDLYSEVDRINAKLHADRLELKYFLFNGGTVRDSRIFCIEHHGKCYSTAEAEKWRELIGKTRLVQGVKKMRRVLIGPIVPSKELYNPVQDMGGYRCRHSADFVPDEIAAKLRKKEK